MRNFIILAKSYQLIVSHGSNLSQLIPREKQKSLTLQETLKVNRVNRNKITLQVLCVLGI